MKKNPSRKKYDEPRPGFRRWTMYVDIKLFEQFKKIAQLENKSLIDALKEAMENWTYVEEK